MKRIVDLRAFVPEDASPDASCDHEAEDHWIHSWPAATPMSKYPAYRASRRSFGINCVGTVLVEVEADDGTVGFAATIGGIPAAFVIEKHFRRFVVGQPVSNQEQMFDQMYHASLSYGRKGLPVHAISAIDCAVWDLLGRIRSEPVWAMIGGKVRERQPVYATGPRPDLAKSLGFIGGKMPLPYGPADGEAGLHKNVELAAQMRAACGPDFILAFDGWMGLTPAYTLRLIEALRPHQFLWLEECLPPDDYAGYSQLVQQRSHPIMIATGEHECTRWGFENLLATGVDVVQPDPLWCGGMTELLKIKAMASAKNRLCLCHASSVYGYHAAIASDATPYAEFLMMSPQADRIVPMFSPLFANEPVPVDGCIAVSDSPGFGVELNPELKWTRPFRL